MDGKPLYEYARSGQPLPRPIQARKVTIHSLELVDWQEAALLSTASSESEGPSISGHRYTWPDKTLDAEQLAATEGVRKLIAEAVSEPPTATIDPAPPATEPSGAAEPNAIPIEADISTEHSEIRSLPPVFTLKMTVSSGTYVRSIVHDLAHAVGSAAHVVSLSRTRQGDFAVGPEYPASQPRSSSTIISEPAVSEEITAESSRKAAAYPVETTLDGDAVAGECIPWEVFEKAIKARKNADFEAPEGEREEWEEYILSRMQTP